MKVLGLKGQCLGLCSDPTAVPPPLGNSPPWCPHAPSLSRRPLLHSSRHRHALPRAPCVKGQGLVTKAGGHSDPRNTHHYLTAAHLQEQEERAEASLWLSLPLPPTQAPPTWMAGGETPTPVCSGSLYPGGWAPPLSLAPARPSARSQTMRVLRSFTWPLRRPPHVARHLPCLLAAPAP